MKKVKVTQCFRDKFNLSHTYNVGETVAFDDDRAADIVKRGLGVMADSVAAKKIEKVEETNDAQETKKVRNPKKKQAE